MTSTTRAKSPATTKRKTTAKKTPAKKTATAKKAATPKKPAKKAVAKKATTARRRGLRSLVTDTLAVLRPGSQFLSIRGYRPADGGVFDITMAFRSSYHRVCAQSVEMLEAIDVKDQWKKVKARTGPFKGKPPFSQEEFSAAYMDLLVSLRESRDGQNDKGIPIREAYTILKDAEKKPIAGIKFHKESRTLHLDGIMIRTTMVEPAPPKPPVNSKPLTLAKNYLKSLLPISSWRQYKLVLGKFETLRVENLTLTPAETRIVG
jgi:hypothetical protein